MVCSDRVSPDWYAQIVYHLLHEAPSGVHIAETGPGTTEQNKVHGEPVVRKGPKNVTPSGEFRRQKSSVFSNMFASYRKNIFL